MVEWALERLVALFLLAGLHLVVEWVVELFLPAVGLVASRLVNASFLIFAYERPCLPVLAHFRVRVVGKDVRFSSEVLPIVRVIALRLVVLLVEWAPLCLEVVHVEVHIFLHKMDDSCLYVPNRVGEGAKFPVFAQM